MSLDPVEKLWKTVENLSKGVETVWNLWGKKKIKIKNVNFVKSQQLLIGIP
jgi:hypothetical protein